MMLADYRACLAIARRHARNGAAETTRAETPDGGLSSDFRDPDGHILSVYQPGGVPA